MANPAQLLVEILQKWQNVPAGQTTEEFRGDPEWAMHRRASGFLDQIEQFIGALETAGDDASAYRESLPEWTAAVFALRTPWGVSVSGPERTLLDVRDLRSLRGLATLMTSTNYASPLEAGSPATLDKAIDRADVMVRDSKIVDIAAKRYLLSLTMEAKKVLADLNTFGEVDLRARVYELTGALNHIADIKSDSPEGHGFRKAAADIAKQVAVVAATLAINDAARRLGLPPA